MYWYLLKIWDGKEADWERCSSELGAKKLQKELEEKKFVYFENRRFFYSQEDTYLPTDIWNKSFDGKILYKSDLILRIISLKGDPKEFGKTGRQFEKKNQFKTGLDAVEPFLLLIGKDLVPLFEEKQGGKALKDIEYARQAIAREWGYDFPRIRIRDDIDLEKDSYKISIKGKLFGSFSLKKDHFLALTVDEKIEGISGDKVTEPVLGANGYWVSEDEKNSLQKKEITVVDHFNFKFSPF